MVGGVRSLRVGLTRRNYRRTASLWINNLPIGVVRLIVVTTHGYKGECASLVLKVPLPLVAEPSNRTICIEATTFIEHVKVHSGQCRLSHLDELSMDWRRLARAKSG